MLPLAARRTVVVALPSLRRSLVSTVLLSRNYEQQSLVDLRKEARSRGLSASGAKASLITRIQEDDKRTEQQQHARGVSSSTPAAAQAVETPATQHSLQDIWAIKLPDLSQRAPEEPVQVPFVPDLWNSSSIKAEQAPSRPSDDTPKFMTVSGMETHPDGGPSHNLYQPSDSTENNSADDEPQPSAQSGSIWRDMADDLGLPASFSVNKKQAAAEILEEFTQSLPETVEGSRERTHSRSLDPDEKKGLWLLGGTLLASWVASRIVAPASQPSSGTPDEPKSH